MIGQPPAPSFEKRKAQFLAYVLFYNLITTLYSIAVFAVLYALVIMNGSYKVLRSTVLMAIMGYIIAGVLAAGYATSWWYSRFTFRLSDVLKPRQAWQGYAFLLITISALLALAAKVFHPGDYAALYLFPPAATCLISLFAAWQWTKRLTEPDLFTKAAYNQEKKWYQYPKVLAFAGGTFLLLVCVLSFLFQQNSFFVSVLAPAALTYGITLAALPRLIMKKTDSLQAGSETEMQYEPYYESVIPVGDGPPQTAETMHGKAAWITDEDKELLTDKDEDNSSSYEGLWLGGGFFHHQEGNLVSVAPPGTGKGAALIIPNLLWERKYKHSFFVFDPKGTNACITARFRQQQGHKVIIIDPVGLQQMSRAKHGIPASCFNPLDHITDDIFNGASQVANLLLPDEPEAKDKYWNVDARNLLQAIILHIMTDDAYKEKRNLVTLHKIVIAADFERLFNEMALNEHYNGLIADTALGFYETMKKSETMFSSLRAVASASLKWLSNPALRSVMQRSDFSPSDLASGDVTVYLCQPITNKEGFATFSRLVTGLCLRANAMPSARPKAWVYYLLDEFPTMGIFPEVIEALAFAREYRMRLWLFAQSLSQLDSIYKQATRHEIMGNATVVQAFGVTDHVTQEYFSKRIGKQTVRYFKRSESSGSSHGASTSHSGPGSTSDSINSGMSSSEEFQGKLLISPEEFEQDPNIITLTKWGPMRLSRWQYWQNVYVPVADYYRDIFSDGRADPNPNMAEGHTDASDMKVDN